MTGTDKYKARLVPWGATDLDTLLTATGTSFHDGDTFNALVWMGDKDYRLTHVRTALDNAPEVNKAATKAAGDAATAYVRTLVDTGATVYLDASPFAGSADEDDFGRFLAIVTLADGRDLATLMISSSHAVADPLTAAEEAAQS